MEAVDNPSYFWAPGAAMGSGASSPETPLPPPSRRSFRSLLRSRSATQAVVQGDPRPCDVAPPRDAVLVGKNDVRYYNMTIPMTGKRRHSIATFLSREPASPGVTAPKPEEAPVPSKPRTRDPNRLGHSKKRCPRCSNKGGRNMEMDDILIITSRQSEAAGEWMTYLKFCFEQISKMYKRPPFRILCVWVEDVIGTSTLSPVLEEKMVHVRLQIVILCSQFLDHIYQHPCTTLGRLLQPDKVIAMLLGVEEGTVTEQHRAALISYQQWRKMPVKDQDELFVSQFLDVAVGILARSWRQLKAKTGKASFSIHPKKVKEGQSKVFVLLNEPLEKEDKLTISVDKNGEHLKISSVVKRNPYTVHFLMPETCLEVSMMVTVYVEKNGQSLGSHLVKCESKMRQLDQILRSCDNPLEFMCQTLGFSPGDREHLDNFLVTAFQRNMPPHFNLLHTPGIPHSHRMHNSPEECPTFLHFAARFGLEKLAWQLLECPGGDLACEIHNACGLTPVEMAEAGGHTKLANALRGYMQMNDFTNMYSYLKIMSEGKDRPCESPDYLQPRSPSETYQVPPSPRTLLFENYQIPPSARPFTPPKTPDESAVYLEMHPSNVSLSSSKHPLDFLNINSTSLKEIAVSSSTSYPMKALSSQNISDTNNDHLTEAKPNDNFKKSQDPLNVGIQDELVEIINDFKNNVFTISEVEKLVENWKNRNDVQQSFKEKQEQLNQMRQEYDRIQQQMKDEMKRPTPFERIRKIFKGKSKDVKESSSCSSSDDNNKMLSTETLPICQRPVSSLSLHSSSSSSSSGRMSTVSGCSGISFGDSGTHSDPEDRKIVLDFSKINGRDSLPNYDSVPLPRPVQSKFSPPQTIIENHSSDIITKIDENTSENGDPDLNVSTDSYINNNNNNSNIDNNSKSNIFKYTTNRHKKENLKTHLLNETPQYLSFEDKSNVNSESDTEPKIPLTPTADYMNVSQDSELTVMDELADITNMRDYMNVIIPSKKVSAPPIPPRIPIRKKM